jgi:MerR family transcriptional regulator/heat shock protein HspR
MRHSTVGEDRTGRDPSRPVYVISVAAELVRVHPRTLRIYEYEGLVCPARTRTNIRLYSENDVRRIMWIRHLTQNLGVNLAGIRVLFELEERLGMRILETLYDERALDRSDDEGTDETGAAERRTTTTGRSAPIRRSREETDPDDTADGEAATATAAATRGSA